MTVKLFSASLWDEASIYQLKLHSMLYFKPCTQVEQYILSSIFVEYVSSNASFNEIFICSYKSLFVIHCSILHIFILYKKCYSHSARELTQRFQELNIWRKRYTHFNVQRRRLRNRRHVLHIHMRESH